MTPDPGLTPRFGSRKTAVIATVVSALLLFGAGTITTVLYLDSGNRGAGSTPTAVAQALPSAGDSSVTADMTALEVLATVEVKGRAPKTGYTRDEFGQRWMDVDRNGCDTRNDILARDLTEVEKSTCKVFSGMLSDPYTGKAIDFVRGELTSAQVPIDHVVSLSDAWQKGAQQLTADQRTSFANDPLNLLAVSMEANSQKSDGDAATWLPKNTSFRCEYVARQVSVKAAYRLWLTGAERDAIARVLDACPDQLAYTSPFAVVPVVVVAPDHVPVQEEPAPVTPVEAPVPAPVYYKNCTEARAAGAAPISQGQPGYAAHLDRDQDGIACDT